MKKIELVGVGHIGSAEYSITYLREHAKQGQKVALECTASEITDLRECIARNDLSTESLQRLAEKHEKKLNAIPAQGSSHFEFRAGMYQFWGELLAFCDAQGLSVIPLDLGKRVPRLEETFRLNSYISAARFQLRILAQGGIKKVLEGLHDIEAVGKRRSLIKKELSGERKKTRRNALMKEDGYLSEVESVHRFGFSMLKEWNVHTLSALRAIIKKKEAQYRKIVKTDRLRYFIRVPVRERFFARRIARLKPDFVFIGDGHTQTLGETLQKEYGLQNVVYDKSSSKDSVSESLRRGYSKRKQRARRRL